MMTFICCILFLVVFFKLLGLAIKLGWGIMKIALYVIFFPVIVLGLIFSGLIFIALPILIIGGIASAAVRVI